MWSLLRFAFLCLVAAAVGFAAVSLPIGGKTAAEYVRGFLETHVADDAALSPKDPAQARRGSQSPPPARAANRVTPPPAADRAPAEDPTEEDRAALEKLLGDRLR